MSRSNPTENSTPNPATRWFEWNGEHGVVRYYDKEAKKNVDVGTTFQFILLDQLGSVRGWHDATESGIYSNEVKDTRQDVLVVRSFKGGTLIEGIYKDIKDRVNSIGGQFVANCYIAYKNGGAGLQLGSMRFKGAALGAWMEFCKTHRADLYKKAIKINGYTEGKKGRIVFRMPVLSSVDLSPESDKAAIALDAMLQEFLKSYFKRTKRDQVDAVADAGAGTHEQAGVSYDDDPAGLGPSEFDAPPPMTDADEIPF